MSDKPNYYGNNKTNNSSDNVDVYEKSSDNENENESKVENEKSNDDELHLFKRVKVGRTNVLRVVKRLPFGAYLSPGSSKGFDVEEILLPKRYEPENLKVDDKKFVEFMGE